MVILHNNRELDQWLAAAPGPVHFVPTMGGLHRGHQQLIRAACGAGVRVLVSVFVNPPSLDREKTLRPTPDTLMETLNRLVPLVLMPSGSLRWITSTVTPTWTAATPAADSGSRPP